MKEHLCRIRKEKNIFISSLKLDTSLFDNQTTNLDWERQTILSSFCHDSRPENWEDILVSSDQTFIKDLIVYGQKNMIKVHMFISSPFAVHYERDIETTTISFVANIGGQSLVIVCHLDYVSSFKTRHLSVSKILFTSTLKKTPIHTSNNSLRGLGKLEEDNNENVV